jgi:hypothetical protein
MTTTKVNKPTNNTPKPTTPNNSVQNTKSPASTQTTQKNQATQKMRMRSKDLNEQKDALFFDQLLQTDTNKQNHANIVSLVQQQNQQNNQQEQENKQQSRQADLVQDIKVLDVQKTQDINQIQTAQFENALIDNHQKHHFEVTIPDLGKFNIQTQLSNANNSNNGKSNQNNSKNLHFDISTEEKKAFDWLNTHQSSIAKNVGKDLNINVTLGLFLA